MSEQNTNTAEPNTTNAPAPAKKQKRTHESFTVGELAKIHAKRRGIDESRAAKEIRGRLRANFENVTKLDPSIKRVKPVANDGNRWPKLNAKVAEYILKPRNAR